MQGQLGQPGKCGQVAQFGRVRYPEQRQPRELRPPRDAAQAAVGRPVLHDQLAQRQVGRDRFEPARDGAVPDAQALQRAAGERRQVGVHEVQAECPHAGAGQRRQVAHQRAAGQVQHAQGRAVHQRGEAAQHGVLDEFEGLEARDRGQRVQRRQVAAAGDVGQPAQMPQVLHPGPALHDEAPVAEVHLGQHGAGVALRIVGLPPRAQQLVDDDGLVERVELGDPLAGALAADHRGGAHHARRLLLGQPVRAGQQVQHERSGLGQQFRVVEAGRRDEPRGRLLDLAPGLVGVHHVGLLQAGRRDQVQPIANPRLGARLGVAAQQVGQDPLALAWPGVRHRHDDHVVPVVQVGLLDEMVQVAGVDDLLRGEIVAERAVHELHLAGIRLAEQPGAFEGVLQHPARFGVVRAQPTHGVRDAAFGLLAGHQDVLVLHQRVREPLQQNGLLLLVQRRHTVEPDAAVLVPADEQQFQRGVVQALAVAGQVHVAVLVQRADQAAQQRVGRQPAQLVPGGQQVG